MTDAEYDVKLGNELLKRDKADLVVKQNAFEKSEKAFQVEKESHANTVAAFATQKAEVALQGKANMEKASELDQREALVKTSEDKAFEKNAELSVRENMLKEKEGKNV